MSEDNEIATPLKEAIRKYWDVEMRLRKTRRQIEQLEKEAEHWGQVVQRQQAETVKLVLTGDSDCFYDDTLVDLGAIEMLLARGIVYECLYCEEQADLADCYGGDHREFHLVDDHHEPCISKALHEYDPSRWPHMFRWTLEEYEACNECDITAS